MKIAQRAVAGFLLFSSAAALPPAAHAQPPAGEIVVPADPRLAPILAADDARVVAAEPVDDKSERPPSRVRVTLESHRAGAAAAAVIDVESGRIVSVERLDPRRLPLGDEDVAAAARLALRDARVRALLGPSAAEFRPRIAGDNPRFAVEGLPVSSRAPGDPCSRDRCLDLLFIGERGYLVGRRVTVDVTAGTVTVTETREMSHD
jgi:hypothetical protein